MNTDAQNMLSSGAFLIAALAFYVFWSIPIYVMAQKAGKQNAWFAFVPILNLWLLCEIAGVGVLWFVLCFVPCVNFVAGIYIWMQTAEAMGKPSWVGLLTIVPCVGFAVPWYLAFG